LKSTMMSSPLLVPSMLERAGKLFPHVEIVSSLPDGSRHSYTISDLHTRSRHLATALRRAGIRRGDRVGTLLWNGHEHLEAYFGISAAGAVVHTLSVRQHPDELAYIMNHAEDRFLIVEDVLLDVWQQVKSRVHCERIFVVDRGKGLPAGTESFEAFLAEAGDDPQYPDLEEDDAAAMCYTSGTTGRPKGVLYSHRSIALHSLASSMPDHFNISRHHTVLPVVSMYHVNAWGLPYSAVMNGSKLVLPGRNLQPPALLDLMQEEQVTLAAGVPTIWMGILDALGKEPDRWNLASELRVLIGGAAAPESMFRRFDKFGIQAIQAWGMTETSPVATVSALKPGMEAWPNEELYRLRARQGLPLPFVEVRAVGDEGEVPWDGETSGELQVRGPWIAGSYVGLEQPDKWTEEGWFRTGDVVTIDSEGYVKITDRLKDLIKSGGEWISSVDLENALVGHAAIREAAVIAVPHPKWQERPLALVVLKENLTVDSCELRSFLQQTFAPWQVPDAFVVVEELPHTSTGKLQKSKLREEFNDWQWDTDRSVAVS
jgi:fatty-acyl-CoA synthase